MATNINDYQIKDVIFVGLVYSFEVSHASVDAKDNFEEFDAVAIFNSLRNGEVSAEEVALEAIAFVAVVVTSECVTETDVTLDIR